MRTEDTRLNRCHRRASSEDPATFREPRRPAPHAKRMRKNHSHEWLPPGALDIQRQFPRVIFEA